MVRVSAVGWAVAAGVAAGIVSSGNAGSAAPEEPQAGVETVSQPSSILVNTADVELRYTQEDGPESGHVRVDLTPESRPLTILEARTAAQQAFLAALTEPGLGDDLSRITVVVRLMPASYVDPSGAEQRFLFLHKGGNTWSVLSGE
jgi:hypothetical protein